MAALNAIDGVRCALPPGAFYAFPHVAAALDGTGETVETLARRLLHEHGVACVPGSAFGPAGAGHLRLAYTAGMDDLAFAVDGVRACVGGLRGVPGRQTGGERRC